MVLCPLEEYLLHILYITKNEMSWHIFYKYVELFPKSGQISALFASQFNVHCKLKHISPLCFDL